MLTLIYLTKQDLENVQSRDLLFLLYSEKPPRESDHDSSRKARSHTLLTNQVPKKETRCSNNTEKERRSNNGDDFLFKTEALTDSTMFCFTKRTRRKHACRFRSVQRIHSFSNDHPKVSKNP